MSILIMRECPYCGSDIEVPRYGVTSVQCTSCPNEPVVYRSKDRGIWLEKGLPDCRQKWTGLKITPV